MIEVDRYEKGVLIRRNRISSISRIYDVDVVQVPWATENGALHKETAVVLS